ncbi:MAG: electron transfer flavoprotein subunit beta/FixA family protein [Desulfosarcina sp.]
MPFSILVCVKAVPDLSSGAPLAIDGHWVDQTAMTWCINPYDAYALEAALAIKESVADVTVEVISAGPQRVRDTIRRAMAMGADAGIHLVMETDDPPDASTTALALADCAATKKYDLILTGVMSEDKMNGITGPLIAAVLDMPCASAAIDIDPDLRNRSITVTCEMEGGMAEIVRLECPAVVTMQTGPQPPRYPSLSNTLRSRRQAIERVMPTETTGQRMPPVTVQGLAFPDRTSTCRVITGGMVEKADALLQLFNEKGWLK